MKERPILFSGPMVRAILDGSKTQTRRLCKTMNSWVKQDCREVRMIDGKPFHFLKGATFPLEELRSPYGQTDDRLWVRETWAQPTTLDPGPTVYRADYPACVPAGFENLPPAEALSWKPSIHMPRALSRITLVKTGGRVERLHDISEADAQAEGCFAGQYEYDNGEGTESARESFECLWKIINGDVSWDTNPWVWVEQFKRA